MTAEEDHSIFILKGIKIALLHLTSDGVTPSEMATKITEWKKEGVQIVCGDTNAAEDKKSVKKFWKDIQKTQPTSIAGDPTTDPRKDYWIKVFENLDSADVLLSSHKMKKDRHTFKILSNAQVHKSVGDQVLDGSVIINLGAAAETVSAEEAGKAEVATEGGRKSKRTRRKKKKRTKKGKKARRKRKTRAKTKGKRKRTRKMRTRRRRRRRR